VATAEDFDRLAEAIDGALTAAASVPAATAEG
jgi:hypothetical protein